VACYEQRPKRELVRVVRTAEGTVEIDPRGKRPGRGAYVCTDLGCWDAALGQHKLARALKCELSESDEQALRETVASLLVTDSATQRD
jgi:predicted RNA-binding protein YlxR (DUF448 family)